MEITNVLRCNIRGRRSDLKGLDYKNKWGTIFRSLVTTIMSSILDELVRRAGTRQLDFSMNRSERIPRIPRPATPRQVAKAEEQLGFPLPPLLRDIYLRVGNGGFGPGCGLFGLASSKPPPNEFHDRTLVQTYTSFRYRSERVRWDEKLLPICTWGCSYFSYLDCALPQAPVMLFDEDSHGHGPWECAFALQAKSFEEWMRRWLEGEDLWKGTSLYGEPKLGYQEAAKDDAPVCLSRTYSVAPDALFEAWLAPKIARRWLFRPPDTRLVRMELNASVAGRFSITVNRAGNESQYSGQYEVIERPRRLVFTLEVSFLFGAASRVSIEVTPVPAGSRLDLTHTGLPGRVVAGPWNHMLDVLGRVLTDRRRATQ